MILIAGTVRVPSGSVERIWPAIEKMLTASRAETGCIRYAYALDVLDQGLVHVNEAWTDGESLQAHFTTPHMAEWRAACAEIGMSDRNLRLYETDEGTPI